MEAIEHINEVFNIGCVVSLDGMLDYYHSALTC